MYLNDLLKPGSDREGYEARLRFMGDLVKDSVSLLSEGWQLVGGHESVRKKELYHGTVFVMARHICESLDAVAVLAEKGCAEPCKPLLRTSLEAILGVEFILESDSERRGMAYQVAHAHRQISLYQRLDPTTSVGQELQKVLASDPIVARVQLPPRDMRPLIANLESMLAQPEFVPIEAEWKRLKGKGPWFHLFGGPANVRELAIRLNHGGMYEFLYRHWSNSVHAGDCLTHVAPRRPTQTDVPEGSLLIRPLRHPEGLQSLIVMAVGLSIETARLLFRRYGTEAQWNAFQIAYTERIRPKYGELIGTNLLDIPWRHDG